MPWSSSRPRSSSYGHEHSKARKAAAAKHQPTDPCTRCGHPLGSMGRWLHYDHADDRRSYLGFAHGYPCPVCRRRCNQRAGAKAGRARQSASKLQW